MYIGREAASPWGSNQRELCVPEAPLVLIVEDDYPLQGVVEDFLREGGFETHALSSGEEALTLFRGKVAEYRALA